MPQPEIKLVLSDVDGTLVTPDKELTAKARKAVSRLMKAGIQFSIISSRPPYGMTSLVQDLQVTVPIVAFNGGILVASDGIPMQEHPVPEAVIPEILDCLRHYRLYIRLFTATRWMITSTDDPHLQHEICTIGAEPELMSTFPAELSGIFKITGVSNDFDAVAACEKSMQALLGNRASAIRSQPYYLDMTHQLANKGQGVQILSECLRVPLNEIAVLGDMLNDVSMFNRAGFSVAMGNAHDEVKQKADYVTDSDTQEGFAKAIDYILQKRNAPVLAHLQ